MSTLTPAPRPAAVIVAAAGGITALAGSYWDDAWHTDRGRDAFLSPPHFVLYLGVFAAIVAVLAAVRRPLGIDGRLAVGGGLAVLVSAPLDEAWHVAFGRDAVLWSPPHMLAVTASLALGVGVLALARRVTGTAGLAARLLAAAGVVGTLQVPVLEFDSDVPQFATWTYLPVAVAGWLLASVLVRRLAPGRWALTAVTAVYTAVRLAIVVGLDLSDHTGTVVPPLLVLAVVDDVLASTGRKQHVHLAVQAVVAPLVWFGWLAIAGGVGTTVPASDLPAAFAATLGAAMAVAMVVGPTPSARSAAMLAGAIVAVAVIGISPRSADAHDPGQGTESQLATLRAERATNDDAVAVTLTVTDGSCDRLTAVRTVARRAGDVRRGELRPAGTCRWRGAVDASRDGRWFIYVEFDDAGRRLELWVPLASDEPVAEVDRRLYEPTSPQSNWIQAVAGALLYAVVVGLLVVTARSTRRLAISKLT